MPKTYTWGIIGPGKIAQSFARDLLLLPNARIGAVASRSQERASAFAEEFGVEKTYSSYGALNTDPEIDIIYVATLHTGHYLDTLLGLNNGKHVLCEKPVAMNSRQLEHMISTACNKGVFFMEALWTRFLPSFVKCLELLHDNVIGDLRIINADFCINPPYNEDSRLFNPEKGGGSLLDIGIYPVFLALEAAGEPEVISSVATLGPASVDTTCSILMRHANGIQSILYSSTKTNSRNEALFCGSKATLRLKRFWHTQTTLELLTDDREPVQFTFDNPGSGYQFEAAEVMRCCDQSLSESTIWSWEKSRRLMRTLDTIRAQSGIRYPPGIEQVVRIG